MSLKVPPGGRLRRGTNNHQLSFLVSVVDSSTGDELVVCMFGTVGPVKGPPKAGSRACIALV